MGLEANLWPATADLTETGALTIGGMDVRELAATYGTALFVVDEADFRARALAFSEAFTQAFSQLGTTVDVYYAGKAFLTTGIVRWLAADGLCLDTCSLGELAVATRAGMPGARVGLHGNNKSDAELTAAIEYGVGRIVVDSIEEIGRIAAIAARTGRVANVMVRVTTGVHAGGHEYIATAHEDQKFGLSLADGSAYQALTAILDHPEALSLTGIHSHIGSQIQDPAAFEVAARKLLALRAKLYRKTGFLVPEVDLGGGYGVAYLPGETALDVPAVAQALAAVIADECEQAGVGLPRISIEPGRAIAAPSTVTLYTVGTVKPVTVGGDGDDIKVRTYVSVDGGMSENIRPALYGARYFARLASRASSKVKVRARVVGQHCEAGDIVIHDVDLPADIQRGDLLAVPVTGAYGRSMASNYNWSTRPAVVAVCGGTATVLVRRERIEDLLALEGE